MSIKFTDLISKSHSNTIIIYLKLISSISQFVSMASLIMLISELLHPHEIKLDSMAYASFSGSPVATTAASAGFIPWRSQASAKESASTSAKGVQAATTADDFDEELIKSLVFVDLVWP